MPSPSVSDFDYAALLYPNGGSSDKFVQGTKAADSDNLIFSFQRPDKTENISFTLEVFAFKAGTAAADYSEHAAVLSGKTTNGLTVNDGSETIEVNETIALSVNASSTAKGEVSLKIAVPEGCSLEIDDTAKTNFTCEKESETSNTYVIAASEIAAGAYKVNFTVMDGEKIVQVFTEYINVLHGMRTDTWGGLAKGAAKEIQITNSASTTFFVRGTGTGWYAENGYGSVTGDDANAGEFLRPFATIQKAVDTVLAMNDGTNTYTIYVDGTFTATSSAALVDFTDLSQPLTVKILGLSESSKAVLDGNGTARGIVVGSGSASSARKDVNLTLENLTVQNAAGNGITLYCQSANAHTIKNCDIKNGNGGSGIYQYYDSLDLQDCTISGNTAEQDGGGVYVESGTFTMKDCTITDCKAGGTSDGDGGGIYNASGTLELKDVTITLESDGTRAAYHGGGIFNAGTLTMKGGSITGGGRQSSNVSKGGGICNTGVLTIEGVTISNFYTVSYGGGIYNNNGETAADFATIKDCIITNCGSAQSGSGICTDKGKLKLENVDIIGGTANTKAGIYCYVSKLTIIGGKIEGFKDDAILTSGSSELKMDGTTVSGNTSTDSCRGVNVLCPFEIKNCTITGNTAKYWTNSQNGGGLYIGNCTGTITNTIITDNTAAGDGGGIYIYGTADVTITDCTIKGNTATTGGGGGIYIDDNTATLKMEGGEISGNTVGGDGGGVYVRNGTFSMSDSASIPAGDEGKNDVYLVSGTTITVADALTAASPVATITPKAYTAGTQVLSAGTGVTITQDICDKFALSEEGWQIVPKDGDSTAGVLKAK